MTYLAHRSQRSRRFAVTDVANDRLVDSGDADQVEWMYEAGWSDGLPLVPPTPDKVAKAVEATGLAEDVVLGVVPPLDAPATVAKVAANAVMAGCLPDYMPVVVAGVRAVCDPRFDLGGVQATTHNAGTLLIVSGSMAEQIGMNWGYNIFGPGNRANATIGRAVRLVLLNVGGGVPGVYDMSTHGHPGKYTYCFAESPESNPWEPFSQARGFRPGATTVTAVAAEAPHSCVDLLDDAETLIDVLADAFCTRGGNKLYFTRGEIVLVLCPEHAAVIDGLGYTRRDLQYAIFERARRVFREIKVGGVAAHARYPTWLRIHDEARIPVVQKLDDILIVVAGGKSVCSSAIPGWGGGSEAVTVEVATST